MRNLIKTLVLMLMLSFSHAAIAGDYEDGVVAYGKGDFATALRLLTPLAEQGLARAELYLGLMYAKGDGVTQDHKTAVKWYTLSAEQGNASAQYSLGIMYDVGRGVEQDYVKSHMWSNIAAIDLKTSSWRDGLAEIMTSTQIEKAQEAASRCIKQNFKNCD